jgi:DNA-binding MarR family transcriptional regulator
VRATRGTDDRKRRVLEAKRNLRDLRIELSMLNHRVGTSVDLKDVELDCLDVLVRHGPLNPSALARRTGVHLATMTGILNRLETAGWIVRERAKGDRRSVVVKAVPERVRAIFGQYGGMNRALDEILDGYDESELAIIIDFLKKATEAGRVATDEL